MHQTIIQQSQHKFFYAGFVELLSCNKLNLENFNSTNNNISGRSMKIQNFNSALFINVIFLYFTTVYNLYSQNILTIENRLDSKITEVKPGDGIQVYYTLNEDNVSEDNKIFIFGIVKRVSETNILLSNGADLNMDKVTNIDRVPFLKRSWLLSAFFGISIGVVGIVTRAPLVYQILAIAPATYVTVLYTVKYNRKHLNANKVGEVVNVGVIIDSTDTKAYSLYPPAFNSRRPRR